MGGALLQAIPGSAGASPSILSALSLLGKGWGEVELRFHNNPTDRRKATNCFILKDGWHVTR